MAEINSEGFVEASKGGYSVGGIGLRTPGRRLFKRGGYSVVSDFVKNIKSSKKYIKMVWVGQGKGRGFPGS